MSLLIRLSGDRKERGMEVKCLDIDFGGSMSSKDKSHRTLSKLGALVGEIRGIRQLRSHDDDK
ncbi:uncharacterized protein PHACADRAFT_266312 [Phanerochaete carnosa HHB-10118-sp]|uniref:Uncharacterized protein n=1 Tax=Phanerochaete carnosa (strain HHB-10118-sp) TaxID=650164 RepID=K5VBN7_PHACS|nr:uncharacterized protein PHACADRAFT_266312 [Phanerochaete carnosa HHB-10118-sp]EKM48523.1 hypothetical protein PHACADRAFT_266312 [Phanerochaete carnosa HHB-10118-sp]